MLENAIYKSDHKFKFDNVLISKITLDFPMTEYLKGSMREI